MSDIENDDRSAEHREQQLNDNRAISIQTVLISATISGSISTFLFLAGHLIK